MTNAGAGTRDYAVGYGKPPVGTRFQPGRSGNPKGRPKKSKGTGQILQDILDAPVSITEGGITRKLSRREIMFKVLAGKAIGGDVRSIKLLLGAMQDFGLPVEDIAARSITVRFVKPGKVSDD